MKYLKNAALVSALALFCICFLSCSRENPCTEASATLRFISFPDTETNTVLLKRFEKATNFVTAIDSLIIDRSNSSYYSLFDTLEIANPYLVMTGKYDYEINLLQPNRTFRISEITEKFTQIKQGPWDKRGCLNPIVSYKLNGQLISGEYNYYRFYLKR